MSVRGFGVLQGGTLRRWGGRIALLAVWVQLALSFGHMHAEDVFGPLGHAVVPGQHADQIAADRHDPAPLAPGDQNPGVDPDSCAICATIHLASTTLLPDAAVLPLPRVSATAAATPAVAYRLTAAPFLLFRTRAPPIV